MVSALEPCDFRCAGCGRVFCSDDEPSPGRWGECPDCRETDGPEDAA